MPETMQLKVHSSSNTRGEARSGYLYAVEGVSSVCSAAADETVALAVGGEAASG